MKKVKQLIIVLVCILLLNGCVKGNITMSINKDKSMHSEIEVLVSDALNEQSEDQSNSSILSQRAAELEKKGYTVIPKTKDGYSGFNISKDYKNIDKLSKGTGEEVNLESFIDNEDVSKTFKLEKGFLKNVYTAKFIFDFDESSINTTDTQTEVKQEETTNDSGLIINNDTIVPTTEAVATTDESTDSDSDISYTTGLERDMEITYVVNLPYAATSNNASKVSSDKKQLTWNLPTDTKTTIEYSFPIYNLTNIIIIGAGALVLLIVIIIVISILSKKKKSTKETLIHTDYDSSIVGQIDETSVNHDEIPEGNTNHEYSVPEEPQVNVTQEPTVETPTIAGSIDTTPQMPQEAVVPSTNVTQGPVVETTTQSAELGVPNMVSLRDINNNQ